MAGQSYQHLDVLRLLELGCRLVDLHQLIFDRLQLLGHACDGPQLGVGTVCVGPEGLSCHDGGQFLDLALQLGMQLLTGRADGLASLLDGSEGRIVGSHGVRGCQHRHSLRHRGVPWD